jgi:CubicO group peptidase (beta-lactamase class C family)
MEAKSIQDKLDIVFSYGNYPWKPGEVARYNSINTFVLGVAMDAFLKSQQGAQADIWDMVIEEVYRPIGIWHAPILRTVEPDGSRGLPIFGYGLYPTADDIAKVAQLYHDGGSHDGEQLLHPARLATALHRIEGAGLPNGDRNAIGEFRYSYSFWALPYRTTGDDLMMVPYMTGYGGNLVVVMPNGITAFRLMDAFNYDVESLTRVGEALRPFPAP